MRQKQAKFVVHLDRSPFVLAVELAVVVADAEVAAGSVVLGSGPRRVIPAKEVAAQGREDVDPLLT